MMSYALNQQIPPTPTPLQARALKEAYSTLYEFVGASKEDHFIFTSSGAEAVNHAVFAAYVDVTRKTGKNHFLCGTLDEAPAIMAMGRLPEMGALFQMVAACEEGYIPLKSVVEKITPRTAMLSLSCAYGLTGVLQPLPEIAALCHERAILFHLEATHLLGKGEFSFQESGADLMSFNGPKAGMGGLVIRKGLEISPFILGGEDQGGMRGGTCPISLLLECAQWAQKEKRLQDHYSVEISRLRSLFEERVCKEVPKTEVLFSQQPRVPHITSLLFPGVESDALSYTLSQKGVLTTFGGSSFQHFSHLLKACGIVAPLCHSALSFAFPSSSTEEEVLQSADIVIESVKQMRAYSTHLMELL